MHTFALFTTYTNYHIHTCTFTCELLLIAGEARAVEHRESNDTVQQSKLRQIWQGNETGRAAPAGTTGKRLQGAIGMYIALCYVCAVISEVVKQHNLGYWH